MTTQEPYINIRHSGPLTRSIFTKRVLEGSHDACGSCAGYRRVEPNKDKSRPVADVII